VVFPLVVAATWAKPDDGEKSGEGAGTEGTIVEPIGANGLQGYIV